MKLSVVIIPRTDPCSLSWTRCLQCLKNQTLPGESVECLYVGETVPDIVVTEALRLSYQLHHCRYSARSGSINQVISECKGEFLLLLDEPMAFSDTYLADILALFDSPSIAAVQSRIVDDEETREPLPFPSRAGFKRFLFVPFLNGRICALRKESVEAVGGCSNWRFPVMWIDLSLRLLLHPRILRTTSRLTAISLAPSKDRVAEHVAIGWDAVLFATTWRAVFSKRFKRFLLRCGKFLSLRLNEVSLYSLGREAIDVATILARVAPGCIGGLVCLPFAPILAPPLSLQRSGHDVLYPWTFFFKDDFGTYASRILLSDHHDLSIAEWEVIEPLILTTPQNSSRNALHQLDGSDEGQILRSHLVRKDILRVESS